MALIDCPECGIQVSSAAVSCPKCAYPIAPAVRSAPGKTAQDPQPERNTADDKPTDWDKLSEWYEREIDPQPEKRAPEQLGEVERDVRSGFPQRTGLSKRNKVMLGVAGVLLLWVIVIVLGGGQQRPSALVATSQPAEASKSTSGFERLCASSPAAFVAEATGIPQDRIKITECDDAHLTVYAYPHNTGTPAGEHLSKLLPAMVKAAYLRPRQMCFIHFKVAERGTTVTGAAGKHIVSRATYDFNRDVVDWSGGR
jgi:hypothetical protein